MKKLFTFSIVSLIIAIIFYISYSLTVKPSEKQIEKETSGIESLVGEGASQLKGAFGIDKIKELSQNAIMAPTIDETKRKLKYYDKTTKSFKIISFDGSLEKDLPDKALPEPQEILWSPNKTLSIMRYGSDFQYYDHNTRTLNRMKDGMDYVVWSGLNSRIIYKYFDAKNKQRSLNVSNLDGMDWAELSKIDFKKVSISPVPQNSLTSFWNYPDFFIASKLNIVGNRGEDEKTLVSGDFGADYLWSPDGTKILESFVQKDSGAMTLKLLNKDGVLQKDLNFPTFASKCVWAKNNKTIFCAMPSDIPTNSILPNEYQEKKFFTKDTFWKIDTESGEKTRLVELGDIKESLDLDSPFLSPDEDILFFVNRNNDHLYRISL